MLNKLMSVKPRWLHSQTTPDHTKRISCLFFGNRVSPSLLPQLALNALNS